MSEWKTVRLGDVCEILDSKRVPITAHERKNGSYPYYGANGIQDYVADYIFDDELVLLAEDGGNFGSKEKPIAYRVSGKCWVNNHAHVLKPKECLDVDYLCDSIKFYDVSTIVNGATRQKLTQSAMVEMKIFLPPLETQKQIAKQLNKCTTLLAKHKQMLETYDTLIKSRFIEIFGDPDQNPLNWEISNLGNFIENANNGMARRGNDKNGKIVLRLVELQRGFIDYSDCNRIAIKTNEEKYLLKNNDFLFARVNGNPDNVGRCCYYKDIGEEVYHNDHIIRVHFDENRLNEYYLNTLLNSEYGKSEFKKYIKTSAGQYTIAQDGISSAQIPIPPIELQNDFASFVQQIDKSKFTVQKSLEKAETLYKSLMQQYFA